MLKPVRESLEKRLRRWMIILAVINFIFLFFYFRNGTEVAESNNNSVPSIKNQMYKIKVASINAWNFRESWKRRFDKFVKLIADEKLDVIGFQELRRNQRDKQYEYMKGKLEPLGYAWHHYEIANRPTADEEEGIAIFSRHPFFKLGNKKDYDLHAFTIASTDSDQNRRILIHNTLQLFHPETNEILLVDLFLAHLSYADHVQCRQAAEILDFTSRVSDLMTSVTDHNVPQILFGDLNIYIDFEYPIELLRGDDIDQSSRCYNEWKPYKEKILSAGRNRWDMNQLKNPSAGKNDTNVFRDVWKEAHPSELGFTFISNTPGLDSCRPDRILISSNADVSNIHGHRRQATIDVEEVHIIEDTSLSDHFPVIATLRINKKQIDT